MELEGRHVVVTGGAGGIGSALARRFHGAGARVVVADLDRAGAERVASELDGDRPASAIGVGADVSTGAGNAELIATARQAFGEIDLFFANAGVAAGGELDAADDDDWNLAFDVNIKAHIFAARLLVPAWLERGDGYFCSTASAAGLLTQIGSAPYSVTKHAAVGFAEWLAITYGDRGLKVSCLCPMGVNTRMLNAIDGPGGAGASSVVRAAGDVLEPAQVAEVVADAIAAEQFLILPHPEVLTFFQRKASDYDRWLAGMRRLRVRAGG